MSSWKLILRSIRHFWAIHFSMALAVAVTTAVIAGALVVGESMRGSLRSLVIKRLGPIDQVMVSQSFFHEATFDAWIKNSSVNESFPDSAACVFFPSGSVEFQPETDGGPDGLRWTSVAIWGTTDRMWALDWSSEGVPSDWKLGRREVVLNLAAAEKLGVGPKDIGKNISLRIGKPSDVPAESFISKKDDQVQSIARLKLVRILPNSGLGKVSMFPTVEDRPAVFLTAQTLQQVIPRPLRRSRKSGILYNAILIARKGNSSSFGSAVDQKTAEKALAQFRPSLEDAGFRLKQSQIVQSFKDGADPKVLREYWDLTSSRMMLDPGQLKVAELAFHGAESQTVLTYLSNDLSISPNQNQKLQKQVEVFPVEKLKEVGASKSNDGIPFSMVSASEFSGENGLTSPNRDKLPKLDGNQIYLNAWAAEDLGAEKGTWVRMKFFQPVSADGEQREFYSDFQVAGVVGLTKPSRPFRKRGRSVIPAIYYEQPFAGNDPNLTPEVPGVTDAASISAWDLPFETASKIRTQDDEYWKWFRTTPKAFISQSAGERMWESRFGKVTSIRFAGDQLKESEIRKRLCEVASKNPASVGIQFQAVKRDGLLASSGSTPFDVLFLMLSMFVVIAALILLSLFFRLGLQYRSDQLGLLFALGFDQKKIASLWVRESLPSIIFGAAGGVLLGVFYAKAIIQLMRTSWVGAVTTVFLETHWSLFTCGIGFASGVLVCWAIILLSIRSYSKSSAAGLVKGQATGGSEGAGRKWVRRLGMWQVPVAFGLAFGLGVTGIFLGGDAQAGSFLTAGFLALVGSLLFLFLKLKNAANTRFPASSIGQVGRLNLGRNLGRTMASVSLIGISVFLVASVSAFRLAPSDRGTAGCDFVVTTDIGVLEDLNQKAKELNGHAGLRIYGFRLHDGQQAGCNNPYRSHLPQVLGVSKSFIERFEKEQKNLSFAWLSTSASSPEQLQNPWRLIDSKAENSYDSSEAKVANSEVIDVVLDKNTAWYSLKVYMVGSLFEIDFPDAGPRTFRLVGLLDNSLLQGTLLISDSDFQSLFPKEGGDKFFLAWDESGKAKEAAERMRALGLQFKDHGWQQVGAKEHLAQFLAVQNTYLNAFQSLGALGLLLGTFGLMIAQYRSLLERTSEFAVFLALGFSRSQIRQMLTTETVALLLMGFGVGLVGALFCVFPHLIGGVASLPLVEIGVVLLGISVIGLVAGVGLVRVLVQRRLVDLLRAK